MKWAAALLAALFFALPAAAQDVSRETVMLVAKRELHDRLYGATILLARPIGNGQHIGFIVNRPTRITLGQLFPEDRPSREVRDPVYLGGPISSQSIFALVRAKKSPPGHSVRLVDDLFAVFDGKGVDDVIEHEPNQARFLAGLVVWRSGELREEIERGLWYVLEPDPALVLRNPKGLWEELVRRAEQRANTI